MNAWANVPPAERTPVRLFINSENEHDRAHALELCRHYKLDYTEMRRIILVEMIEESRSLGKSWTPAAGSRPLSPEPTAAHRRALGQTEGVNDGSW